MSTVALLALATLQIGQTFPITVGTQNHALFAAFVCMAIVAGAAVVAVRGRRLTLDRAEWLRTFAPPVRWSLVGLYFFAVFHKLNRDWFDPAVSCGTEFYLRQRDVFSFLPASEWAVQGGIWGSFAVEAAIPLLLAFERSRHAGVLLGLVFHWALAANPLRAFFNFSSMLFAVFVLFLSADRVAAFADRLGRRRIHLLRGLVVVVFGVWAAAELMGPAEALPDSRAAGRIAWYVWGSVLTGLAVAVVAGRARSAGPSPALFALRHPLLALVPVLVVLNGLSPYLGLHTTANWAMFSNLRTEGGRSNHLIVPADWQLFDYQRELVRVVRSSDRYLQSSSGRLIPYFEI
jgi:hypothetical protein